MSRRLIVEADGGSRGNPGPAGYGALVRDADTGELLAERSEAIGIATNNVAEYRGLIAGLTAAVERDPQAQVEVRMDSKLVVEQMSGRWQIKHEDMRALARQARAVLPSSQVRYTWIPRAQNAHADRLANQAMDGKPVATTAPPAPMAPGATAPSYPGTGDAFGDHADAWQAWQASPWGRLRYRVVAHVLSRVIDQLRASAPGGPLRILDVGGGDGGDAVPLALAGHRVTLVDPSPELLATAARRAEAAGAALTNVQGSAAELGGLGLPELDRGAGYDLVLCHFVVPYVPDAAELVRQLAVAIRPGGRLSIAATNPAADVLLAVTRDHDPAAALALLDAPTRRSATFDTPMRRVVPETVTEALHRNGFDDVEQFGIRCVSDYLADEALKHDPAGYAALERLELALCDREPYLRTARLWQLVAGRD